jgi:ribosomal protein S18 acetylase RimI-like enzyme
MLTPIFYNTFYRGKGSLAQMLSFRPVLRADLPALLRMSKENMSSIIQSSWGMEWQDEPVLEWLTDRSMSNEVAEWNGEVVGYYCLEVTDRFIFITSIQVDRSHQGQGLGGLMMDRIETLAKDKGMEGVELCVQETNLRARSFYQERGYEPIWRKGSNVMMRKRLAAQG